jgi:hypothetical protein
MSLDKYQTSRNEEARGNGGRNPYILQHVINGSEWLISFMAALFAAM